MKYRFFTFYISIPNIYGACGSYINKNRQWWDEKLKKINDICELIIEDPIDIRESLKKEKYMYSGFELYMYLDKHYNKRMKELLQHKIYQFRIG